MAFQNPHSSRDSTYPMRMSIHSVNDRVVANVMHHSYSITQHHCQSFFRESRDRNRRYRQ